MKKIICLASSHMAEEESRYLNEGFDTNWVAPLGPNVNNFEKDICGYRGGKATIGLVVEHVQYTEYLNA